MKIGCPFNQEDKNTFSIASYLERVKVALDVQLNGWQP